MTATIHTRYVEPGLSSGSKIKAFCKDGSRGLKLTVSFPHELHSDEKHVSAAKALAERLQWEGLWIVGQNYDGSISCACLPGSYSRAWVDKYIVGKENTDWFFVERVAQ